MKSSRLAYELDIEPKVLLIAPEGDPGWHNLDLTPNVEYAWRSWKGEGKLLGATSISTKNGKLELETYSLQATRLTEVTEKNPKVKK